MPIPSHMADSPPTPSYIFRYHKHPVHALHFFRNNNLFASGDSSGLLVIWRLVTRRPVAAFQAHDAGIMGIKDWGEGRRLVTHGRDHKLRVWEIKPADLEDVVKDSAQTFSSGGEDSGGSKSEGKTPWLLHSMSVNALNFCAFSICPVPAYEAKPEATTVPQTTTHSVNINEPSSATESIAGTETDLTDTKPASGAMTQSERPPQPLLLASPNGLDSSGIDIFHLPSEHRISQIRSTKDTKTGMVMALNVSFDAAQNRLILVSGYEDGSVAVHEMTDLTVLDLSAAPTGPWKWTKILQSRPHSQPVLSLDVTPDWTSFITSSADAIIAKFAVPPHEDTEVILGSSGPERTNNTKHAGQQDLKIRSDGKIFVTAGWDGNVRVYSVKTCKELAVLQWHKDGCYTVAFAGVSVDSNREDEREVSGTSDQSLVQMNGMDRMKLQRGKKLHNTHWIVAGSKDGKISLWDIY